MRFFLHVVPFLMLRSCIKFKTLSLIMISPGGCLHVISTVTLNSIDNSILPKRRCSNYIWRLE